MNRLKTYTSNFDMHYRNPSRPQLLRKLNGSDVFCRIALKRSKEILHTPFIIEVIESVSRRNDRQSSSLKSTELISKVLI